MLPIVSAAAASSSESTAIMAPVPTLMPSQAPPSVGTTPPELMPDATATPRNWIEVGPIAFNADVLTLEERAKMIRQLQASIMRTSLTDYELVAGLDTTRERPCYMGQSARFRQAYYGDSVEEYWVTMTLMQITRGEEAEPLVAPMISQIYSEGDILPPNMEFLVCDFDVWVSAEDTKLDLGTELFFTMYDFQTVSENGKPVEFVMLFAGAENTLYTRPGNSGTIRVVLAAEKGTNPTILYRKKIWFSVLEPEE